MFGKQPKEPCNPLENPPLYSVRNMVALMGTQQPSISRELPVKKGITPKGLRRNIAPPHSKSMFVVISIPFLHYFVPNHSVGSLFLAPLP